MKLAIVSQKKGNKENTLKTINKLCIKFMNKLPSSGGKGRALPKITKLIPKFRVFPFSKINLCIFEFRKTFDIY